MINSSTTAKPQDEDNHKQIFEVTHECSALLKSIEYMTLTKRTPTKTRTPENRNACRG